MREGRYGQEVLRTPDGSWFWSRLLQLMDYIPVTSRRPQEQLFLPAKANDLRGAIRAACRAELAREASSAD